MMKGIHNYERTYKTALEKVQNEKLVASDKKLIFRFIDDCVLDGLSKPRLIRLMQIMRRLSLQLKGFEKADTELIKKVVMRIETNQDYSAWTKVSYKAALKKLNYT